MNTTTTRVMALRTFFAETTAEVAREWDAHRAALV